MNPPKRGFFLFQGITGDTENRGDLNAAKLAALFLFYSLILKKYPIIEGILSGVGTISPGTKNRIPGLANGGRNEPGIVRDFRVQEPLPGIWRSGIERKVSLSPLRRDLHSPLPGYPSETNLP